MSVILFLSIVLMTIGLILLFISLNIQENLEHARIGSTMVTMGLILTIISSQGSILSKLAIFQQNKQNMKATEAKRKLCEIRSNLTDKEQKQAICIAIRVIYTCIENGFIVED